MSRTANRARPNQTGRNDKTARFIMMPMRVIESAAYASLDLTARALLQELVHLHSGTNNGSIYLSVEDARLRLGLADKRPVLRAFGLLEASGLVELTKAAHFDVKTGEGSRARCWRLAWLQWNECPNRNKRTPQWGWEQFQASGKPADRRLKALAKHRKAQASGKFSGVISTPLERINGNAAAAAGVKSPPASPESDAIPPIVVGVKSTPYIDVTRRWCVQSWWVSSSETQMAALAIAVLKTVQANSIGSINGAVS